MKTRIITDSGSGLSQAQAAEKHIDFLPLQVTIDDKNYMDGIDLTIKTLYDELEDGKMPSTSLPPLGLIEDLMDSYQKEGVEDIVLISLSSGLSSTNSAVAAAAKAHGIKAWTTDIYTTLGVEKYLALAAASLAEQGIAPEEIVARIRKAVDGSAGYLIANDLDHLAKGGRLTPAAAKLGGLLKIKPILEVSKRTEGKVDVMDKVRTMSKAVKKAADKVLSELEDGVDYQLIVLDSRNPQDAKAAADLLEEQLGAADIWHEPMYAVIAAHTGLGAVGIQYIPKVEGAVIE